MITFYTLLPSLFCIVVVYPVDGLRYIVVTGISTVSFYVSVSQVLCPLQLYKIAKVTMYKT